MPKTVVIIGAGPAGLTAAYEFLRHSDIKPIILESSEFIGGISRTANYKGNRMDIGGHRFFTKDDRVIALWNELLPLQGSPAKDDLLLNRKKDLKEGGPNPEKTDDVMLIRTRVSRIFFLRKFFDYPISLKFRTFANMGFFRTMKAGFGYLWSAVFKKKEDNLENFYINRFGRPLYEMFFEDYTEKVWGIHPTKISADWGAQRVKGLSLMKAVWNVLTKPFRKSSKKQETSLIEQFSYPKKGPGQLYEKMASEIVKMGGTIIMNATVNKVNIVDGDIESIEALVNDKVKTYKADYYLSSMPIKDLVMSIGQENVDKDVYETAINLPYRDFITVGLLVDKLKIKNNTKMLTVNNIVPDCWIYVQDRDVKLGRIQIFNNWSPYMVKDLEKYVWMGLEYFCNEGDAMWETPTEEFISKAIDELVKIGIIESRDNVKESTEIKVKKAYPAYFGSYENFNLVKDYLNSIKNLSCIGRNGQHRYNNMDHSMVTALVAADNIINGVLDKEALWNVNTEKDYHEEKEGK